MLTIEARRKIVEPVHDTVEHWDVVATKQFVKERVKP